MKKFVTVFICISLIFSAALPVHADGPVKKLGRGIANIVTSPFAFIKGMGDANRENGIFAGLTWGVLKGTGNVIKRLIVGAYEVVTFPLPFPKDYAPILKNPEFFLEDMM